VAAPGRAEQGRGRRKGRGEKGRLTGGAHLSARGKQKKKEGGGAGWRGEKTDGPLGRKGREVSFLFFSCSNSFLTQSFLFKFKPNSFKLFHKNFINFLEVTQATKSYAKPNDDAQPLVVSILIKFSLIF
jgi:hypothetical protein